MSTRVDPEERDELERERDFLLKSLDDLETERSAGNIDDESYRELHDDYTARAAAAIRALRDGVDARPAAPAVPWRRRGFVIGAIVAFAALAAVTLAAALGARLPGQTSSGNSPSASSRDQRQTRLEEVVRANPNDAGARLALARFLEEKGDIVGSLKQLDEAVKVAPDNADALANAGRVRFIVAGQVPSPDAQRQLVAGARTLLDRAVQADPNHADAHFYRGVLLLEGFNEVDAAVGEFQRYLVLAPEGQFATQARNALAQTAAAPGGAGTVPP
jgi:cytochrome c-type biogenesis protein CcmH/NrfG